MRLRLLPIVIVAAVLLLAETVWLAASGRGDGVPAGAPQVVRDVDPTFRPVAAASEAVPADDVHAAHADDLVPPVGSDPVTTGSIEPAKPPAGTSAPKTEPAAPPPAAATAAVKDGDGGLADSPAERKLLDDLHSRQSTLDQRAQALDLRENLLAAAQMRLDQRIAALKALGVAADPDNPAAPGGGRAKRLDDVVAIYAGMKPKDAAKIFDHLDLGMLTEIAARMKPRQFSEILGLMDTTTAQRLTLALAGRGVGPLPVGIDSLPKIEGHPTVP